MEFSWSQQQLEFRDRVRRFAVEQLQDDICARDQAEEFAADLWQRSAEFGIQGMSVEKAFGGRDDADILTAMLAMEALGGECRDTGFLFALNAQMWTVQLPISHYGTDEQKSRFLPGLCDGSLVGAHAVTEPEAGSDVFALQTRATPCDGGYRLDGTKCLVSLAPIADLLLVFATINPDAGRWGVTAFLVESDIPGIKIGPSESKMGLRTVPIGRIDFVNCLISESNRLGAEGAGFSISQHSLEFERCCILASQIGAMERQLQNAIAHVRQRKQFGQSIGKFQSVSNRIAEMRLRLETARLLLYKVAWLKQQGKSAMLEAAMLKLHLSECFVESSLDAIRVFGGHGYLTKNEIERDLRDAVGGLLYAGTSDIQRNIISGLLGL
jgi:L-prolyl-PCP dehydrogenase